MAGALKADIVEKPRSRGRRPTFDRDEALEIALHLFWRHGYEGVSLATLTGAMGIAAPSLYHAFGSKDALYREALRRYQAAGLSDSAVADSPSSFEAVRKILAFGISAVTNSKRPAGCMVSSGLLTCAPEHLELAKQVKKERGRQRVTLQKLIQRDIEAHALAPSVNAAALARFYMAVLQGISVQAIDGATSAELKAIMEVALLSWPHKPVP